MLAILWGAVRAVANGYVPMSDLAIFEIRARDVFSSDPPLLGLYSTAQSFADPVFHPGPLALYLLAVPVLIGRHGAGLAVGAAIVNAAAMFATPWAASKFLGRTGAAIVAAVTAGMVWTLGSEHFYDVFPSSMAVVPTLLLLVAAWGWASGHDALAPVAVVAFSLAGQTHGSVFVVGLGILATAAAIRVVIARSNPLRRTPLAVAGGVLIVLWIPPIMQQFFGSGPGNLGQIVTTAAQDERATLGAGAAARALASVLTAPPWWTRSGYTTQLPEASRNGGDRIDDIGAWPTAPSVLALVGLAVVVTGAAVWLRRRGDGDAVSGALLIVVGAFWGFVYTTQVPLDELLGFMVHTVRWMWPLGAFITIFLAVCAQRLLAEAHRPAWTWQLVGVGSLAAVATFPAYSHGVGPNGTLAPLYGAADEIRSAVGELDGRGVVYVDLENELFDPFADAVLAELTARDIPYVVDDPYRAVQLGEHRTLDADADTRLRLVHDPYEQLPGDADVLVWFTGLDPPADDKQSPRLQAFHAMWDFASIRLVVELYDEA